MKTVMGKNTNTQGDRGLGGSLKNSLSKLTQKVSLKAPPQEKGKVKAKDAPRPKATSAQVSTPKPMSPPVNGKSKVIPPIPANEQSKNKSQPAAKTPVAKPQPAAKAPEAKSQPAAKTPEAKPQPAAKAPETKAQPAAKAPETKPKPQPAAKTPEAKPQPAAKPQSTATPPVSSTPAKSSSTLAAVSAQQSGSNQIADDVVIEGKLTFPGSLTVDGKIRGEIHSEGHLSLLPQSVVEAQIAVKTILVEGKVVGNITATESVTLASTATVIGDISTPRLSMEPGSSVLGQNNVGTPTEMK